MTTQDITLASVSNAFTTDANNIALAVKPAFLPIASSADLGAIKIGANLSIAADGTLSANSTGNPAVWLTGNGDPADSLGVVGNYYQDISLAIGNRIWLKTQTTTSPFWVRQPNFESTIASYNQSFGVVFGFAYVATTANITLTGLQTIDGIALTAGDVVLVIAQTTSSENGLYVAASGAWTRSVTPVIEQGLVIQVTTGTANGGSSFVQTLPITTVGTSAQSWALYSSSGVPTLLGTMSASSSIAQRTIPVAVSPIILGGDLTNPISLTPSATGYAITAPTGIEIRSGRTTNTTVRAVGTAANIDLTLQVKGSGLMRLGSDAASNSNGVLFLFEAGQFGRQRITGFGSNVIVSLEPSGGGDLILGNTDFYAGFKLVGAQPIQARFEAVGREPNIDIQFFPKGTGRVLLTGGGGFFPLGATITGAGTTQPKIAVATAANALTVGFGAPGQVLTSNGTAGSPYWAALPGSGQLIVSFSGTSVGSQALALTTQRNTLGVQVLNNFTLGFVPNGFYQVIISAAITQTSGTAATFNAYFSCQTANAPSTNVTYGSGTATSVIKANTTISNNDSVSANNIGYFTATSAQQALYVNAFITGAQAVSYNGLVYIGRLA